MEDIQQALKAFDLNDKEVSLYLAALQLGESGITALARKAGLKKTTAYLVFKNLEEKGLMGSFGMRAGLKFVASKPEIFLSKVEKQLAGLRQVIPELRAIANQADKKPKITYYEGKEGYFIAANDSIKVPNSIVRHIGSIAELHRIIGEEYDFEHYIPTRIKKNIRFKAIYPQGVGKRLSQSDHKAQLREIRYLPDNFVSKTSTIIYGNKVAITSSQKDLMTIIIESEDIAQEERQKFDLIWNLLDTQHKEKRA